MGQLITPGAQANISLFTGNQNAAADRRLEAMKLQQQREELDAHIKLTKEQMALDKSQKELDRLTLTEENAKQRQSAAALQQQSDQAATERQQAEIQANRAADEANRKFQDELFRKQAELEAIKQEVDAKAALGAVEEAAVKKKERDKKQAEIDGILESKHAFELAKKKLTDPNLKLAEMQETIDELNKARAQTSTNTKLAVTDATKGVVQDMLEVKQTSLAKRLLRIPKHALNFALGGLDAEAADAAGVKEGYVRAFEAKPGIPEDATQAAAVLSDRIIDRVAEQGVFGKDGKIADNAKNALKDVVKQVVAMRAVEQVGDAKAKEAQAGALKQALRTLQTTTDASTMADVLQAIGDTFEAVGEGSDLFKAASIDEAGNYKLEGLTSGQVKAMRQAARWLSTVDNAAQAYGFSDPAKSLDAIGRTFKRAQAAVNIMTKDVDAVAMESAVDELIDKMTPEERKTYGPILSEWGTWAQKMADAGDSIEGLDAKANLLLGQLNRQEGEDMLSTGLGGARARLSGAQEIRKKFSGGQ